MRKSTKLVKIIYHYPDDIGFDEPIVQILIGNQLIVESSLYDGAENALEAIRATITALGGSSVLSKSDVPFSTIFDTRKMVLSERK